MPAKKKSIDFESSLSELEKLVSSMEEDSLPLEKMIELYERGTKLVAECEDTLQSARKKLETIKAKPHKQTPSRIESETLPIENDQDDDIRLF